MELDHTRVQQVAADMGERLRRVNEEIKVKACAADDLATLEPEPVNVQPAPVLIDGLDQLAADAARLIDQPLPADLAPAVNNLLIGLKENGGNVAELVQGVRDVHARAGGEGDITNRIADAVQQARTVAAQSPAVRKAMEAVRQRPGHAGAP